MPENTQQAQVETYLARLHALMAQGRQVKELVTRNPTSAAAISANRMWQQECGAAIHQLSGGSKAHWLARAFSEAFLIRTTDGQAARGAAPEELVQRLLGVLEQGVASLSRMSDGTSQPPASAAAPPRFTFVHDAGLRQVVEQAYADSRLALEQCDYDTAMRAACGILEAIVTNALEYQGRKVLDASGAPEGPISEWTFETRLAIAEKTGLIRGGWARLSPAARIYRDESHETHEAISEHDARTAIQVLNVLMRDLNPGR